MLQTAERRHVQGAGYLLVTAAAICAGVLLVAGLRFAEGYLLRHEFYTLHPTPYTLQGYLLVRETFDTSSGKHCPVSYSRLSYTTKERYRNLKFIIFAPGMSSTSSRTVYTSIRHSLPRTKQRINNPGKPCRCRANMAHIRQSGP